MTRFAITGLFGILCGVASGAPLFTESFDAISTLSAAGWALTNNSVPLGESDWFQGNPAIFPSQSGATDSYIAANFLNAGPGGNISNWLITPVLGLVNGLSFSFYTRSNGALEDRLEVRLNPSGTTDTGDFTTLLLTVNPALDGNYPTDWTLFNVIISGLPVATNARIGFRYFVPDTNANGDYIGVDTFEANIVPEPAPAVLAAAGLAALILFRRRAMLLGLIACVSVSVAAAGEQAKTKKPAEVRKEPAGSGMRISRDPETGQLESGPLTVQPGAAAARRIAPPQQVRLPNGLIMARTTDAHMSTSVVTRDADGGLSYHCVDGKKRAKALIEKHERDSRMRAAGKERGHAVR